MIVSAPSRSDEAAAGAPRSSCTHSPSTAVDVDTTLACTRRLSLPHSRCRRRRRGVLLFLFTLVVLLAWSVAVPGGRVGAVARRVDTRSCGILLVQAAAEPGFDPHRDGSQQEGHFSRDREAASRDNYAGGNAAGDSPTGFASTSTLRTRGDVESLLESVHDVHTTHGAAQDGESPPHEHADMTDAPADVVQHVSSHALTEEEDATGHSVSHRPPHPELAAQQRQDELRIGGTYHPLSQDGNADASAVYVSESGNAEARFRGFHRNVQRHVEETTHAPYMAEGKKSPSECVHPLPEGQKAEEVRESTASSEADSGVVADGATQQTQPSSTSESVSAYGTAAAPRSVPASAVPPPSDTFAPGHTTLPSTNTALGGGGSSSREDSDTRTVVVAGPLTGASSAATSAVPEEEGQDSPSVRPSTFNGGVAARGPVLFNRKNEVQTRWREFRGSYPTLRELIRQLVRAYKEERRTKILCSRVLRASQCRADAAAGQKNAAVDKNDDDDAHAAHCGSENDTARFHSDGGAAGKTKMPTAAECAKALPGLRTSLDWVRYLPYVPVYPIDVALRHLQHEQDDDILLALFYAPDLFHTYNYIQWMGLMVKATCSLLRAGVLAPLSHVPSMGDEDEWGAAFASATNRSAAAALHEGVQATRANTTGQRGGTLLYCPDLVLPSTSGLFSERDVQRMRDNGVRIAFVDGYYPQRNFTPKVWSHMGPDTYMVREDLWRLSVPEEAEDESESEKDSAPPAPHRDGVCDGSPCAFPSRANTSSTVLSSPRCFAPGDNATPADGADTPACTSRLPMTEKMHRSSESWGPVFVEQRNAFLRLLAKEGGLSRHVQEALRPTAKAWPAATDSSSSSRTTTTHPTAGVTDVTAMNKERRSTMDGTWAASGAEAVAGAEAADGSEPVERGVAAPPVLSADEPQSDHLHFLARYIIEHTDDLILSRPERLLEALQRSFDRLRRREQRLVEKIFSWGQIMKYRVHVNVSAQRIDEFSSDHVCEMRYQVYLHSPHPMERANALREDGGSDGGATTGSRLTAPRDDAALQLERSERRAVTRGMADDDDDADGMGARASCYHYQQMRNSRVAAALGSASAMRRPRRRRTKRRQAVVAAGGPEDATAVFAAVPASAAASGDEGVQAREGGSSVAPPRGPLGGGAESPNDTATPRAGAVGSRWSPRRGNSLVADDDDVDDDSNVEEGEDDGASFFDPVLAGADERDTFHEISIEYVDGMDELAIEEGSREYGETGTARRARREAFDVTGGRFKESNREEEEEDGRAAGRESSGASLPADGSPESAPSPAAAGFSGPYTNSLRLLGAAARRNYLLRQTPPVLLFPRKQGSRPYVFPQTLLRMVYLSFAGSHSQLPPEEHARRLRARWGCSNASLSSSSPCRAKDAASCAAAKLNVSASTFTDARSTVDEARKTLAGEGGGTAAEPTEAPFTDFTDAAAVVAIPTPHTYRVVSVLDNPFSRIGVDHLHYDFIISGPSSPTAVLQLLVEEARRVSTPGELEARTHREVLYRLQHRQWLEAHPRAALWREGDRSSGAADDGSASRNAWSEVERSEEADETAKGGGGSGPDCSKESCSHERLAGAESAPQRECDDNSSSSSSSSSATAAEKAAPSHPAAGDADTTAAPHAPVPHSAFERMPEAELARREYGSYHVSWRERFLQSAVKEMRAHLHHYGAERERGVESEGGDAAGDTRVAMDGDGGNGEADNDSDGGSGLAAGRRRRTVNSEGPPCVDTGYFDSRATSNATSPAASAAAADEGEEEYFFEHDIAFRLDPERFVESAPLTLHFFLRTPSHVVETELIEPLREHIRVIRQRLLNDILADVNDYGSCELSGNRYLQLLRSGVERRYINGTCVAGDDSAASATSSAEKKEKEEEEEEEGREAACTDVPFAFTTAGAPLVRCLRSSAALHLWRATAELQSKAQQRAMAAAGAFDDDSTTPTTALRETTAEAAAVERLIPLPRDVASMVTLLRMPYNYSRPDTSESNLEVFGGYSDTTTLDPHQVSKDASGSAGASREMDAVEVARLRENRATQERLLLLQIAFRELMRRSSPSSATSFFQLFTIDREAAMPVAMSDPSRVAHRTSAKSISSAVSALPVALETPVYPRDCLVPLNNTYMAVMYLFFNGTAERVYREHALNRRRVRLMQRLDEAVRLARQARLILLTATEDDYRTQYLDTIIQDAARRYFIIRQVNRNRNAAAREMELWLRQHPQAQKHETPPFSSDRSDAASVIVPLGAGGTSNNDDDDDDAGEVGVEATRRGGYRLLDQLRDRLRTPSASDTSADATSTGTKTTNSNADGAGNVDVSYPVSSTRARPDEGEEEEEDDEDDDEEMYHSDTHLSPFQFNIIHYDVESAQGTPNAAESLPSTTDAAVAENRREGSTKAKEEGEAAGDGGVEGTRQPQQRPHRHRDSEGEELYDARAVEGSVDPSQRDSSEQWWRQRRQRHRRRRPGEGPPYVEDADAARTRVLLSGRVDGTESAAVGVGPQADDRNIHGSDDDNGGAASQQWWRLSERRGGSASRLRTSEGIAAGQQDEALRNEIESLNAEMRRLQARARGQPSERQESDDTSLGGASEAEEQPQHVASKRSWWLRLLHRHGWRAEDPHDVEPPFTDHHEGEKEGEEEEEREEVEEGGNGGTQHHRHRHHHHERPHSSPEASAYDSAADTADGDGGAFADARERSGAFTQQDEFEQGGDVDTDDLAPVITGEKTDYEASFPFPWNHGELTRQEVQRLLEEHQRRVRALKHRLIDVRLRWASTLWNERQRPPMTAEQVLAEREEKAASERRAEQQQQQQP